MATVKDLSQFHYLLSDFFKTPETQAEWDQFKLTDEQVKFFHENGYLSGIKLLEEWQIDALLKEQAEIADPEHPGHHLFYEFHTNESSDPNSVLFHSLGHWRITKGFHDIVWNPAFVRAASQLLGNVSVRLWHDQLFCKPAKHGGVVAWHQDYSYWTCTKPMQHLTCWVGLDDATTENGCLYYVPGSHHWGLLDRPNLAGDMNGLMEFLTEDQKKAFKPIPVELKRGYATFHHPLLVHGSYENKSERSRKAFVLNAFADGTKSDIDDDFLDGIPFVKKGKKMEGQFFPLLYQV
ncbi:MAG: phytanoyl-CoA dioxygenase family protein [Chitinophagaceae bacterium]|nr:phytanoyl-CoA dioxygenase family protein [Chitinophagaceae bacterium]